MRDNVQWSRIWVFVLCSYMEEEFIWIVIFFGGFDEDILVLVFVKDVCVEDLVFFVFFVLFGIFFE